MQLTDVDTLKLYGSIGGDKDDDLLDMLITQVSAQIQGYLNRDLKPAERTEYFDGGSQIYLRAYPVDGSESITIKIHGVETVDYYIDLKTGIVTFLSSAPSCYPNSIEITYTGGYVSVPDDLQLSCCMQTNFVYRRRKDEGSTNINMESGSIQTQPSGLLEGVKEILDSYRSLGHG